VLVELRLIGINLRKKVSGHYQKKRTSVQFQFTQCRKSELWIYHSFAFKIPIYFIRFYRERFCFPVHKTDFIVAAHMNLKQFPVET